MTLNAILYILTHSKAKDWYRTHCGKDGCGPSYYYRIEESTGPQSADAGWIVTGGHTDVAAYKDDVSITMAWGMADNGGCYRGASNTNADPGAVPENLYLLDLFYSGSLVFRTTYFEEDGFKLPVANAKRKVPERYADAIRKLNELAGEGSTSQAGAGKKPRKVFEEAMRARGIAMTDEDWPE